MLMVIGVVLLPKLDVSNEPRPRQGKILYIQYNWHGASAKVIEQNVTSVIEGLVASVKGVENVSSDSYFGSGRIVIELKKDADVSSTKFEIASLLRQIRKKLPKELSYPSLTGGEIQTGHKNKENGVKHILTYQVNAGLEDIQIKELVEKNVKPDLEQIDGVHHIDVTGGKEYYMEISYDAHTLANYGLTAYDLEEGIRQFMGKENIIGDIMLTDKNGEQTRHSLFLATKQFARELEAMPIKTIEGKIVYLNNLATYTEKEREPESYYRVNGMNTIYINIMAEPGSNIQQVAEKVKHAPCMNLQQKNVYFTKTYDRAEVELSDFRTLMIRSGISLLLLLFFVWLSRREWKYLIIITATLLANILIAVIAFWALDIRLHPFSLAGVTVSLGFIIDSSIVMVDHYSYYHNHRAFIGILAALFTTIASLVVVFWLPEHLKNELYDFSSAVIINLMVALLVAALFVPAMVEKLNYNSHQKGKPRHMTFVRGWNRIYSEYIVSVQKKKWIYIMLLILAFGIPIHLLPEKIGKKYDLYNSGNKQQEEKWYETFYNTTLGSDFFQQDCKEILSTIFGGSIWLFSKSLSQSLPHEEEEMKLNIRAQMPLGGSVTDLNEKVGILETFISQFKEIKRYETHIDGWGAHIIVEFTKEALHSEFPYTLEKKVISKVIMIGGADWSTYGVSERGFSNSLNLQYRANYIEISGYDYTKLYRYAENICQLLEKNGRVTDITIETPGHENQEDELYMQYNRHALNLAGINVYDIHQHLQSMLMETEIGRYEDKYIRTTLVLRAKERDNFDLWQLENSYLRVDERDIRVSDFMDIRLREAKNCISRRNQEYVLRVAFNMLGSNTYTQKFMQSVIDEIEGILPVGFRCQNSTYGWNDAVSTQYWLIGLIAIIIFFICAALFENLRQAFIIILLIPTSLIGMFLTYYLSGVSFGTGGFAAMILLCGLSVNAGIYLLNEYNHLKAHLRATTMNIRISHHLFVKAYNHKIIPIILTVISTVIGLIPFIFDGEKSSFWFSFAVGAMGGLLFSLVALVFVTPILFFNKAHLTDFHNIKSRNN